MSELLGRWVQLSRWVGAVILLAGTIAPVHAEDAAKDCAVAGMTLVAAADETIAPADGGTVEERGVPRMSPGRPPLPPLKGGVLEGNRLRVLPGYALDVRPDGSAFMLRPPGGGFGATGRCSCSTGGGTCSAKRDGNDGVKCVSKGCDACGIIVENAAIGGGLKAIQ